MLNVNIAKVSQAALKQSAHILKTIQKYKYCVKREFHQSTLHCWTQDGQYKKARQNRSSRTKDIIFSNSTQSSSRPQHYTQCNLSADRERDRDSGVFCLS